MTSSRPVRQNPLVAGVVHYLQAPTAATARIVIIDACAHDVLLAGLTQIDVPARIVKALVNPWRDGENVRRSRRSSLYIEARRDGRPIDPALPSVTS